MSFFFCKNIPSNSCGQKNSLIFFTYTIHRHHPARDIHIIKELEDIDTMERQAVNFLCEVNQVDVDGRWYRDDCRIRSGDNIKIRHNGRRLEEIQ